MRANIYIFYSPAQLIEILKNNIDNILRFTVILKYIFVLAVGGRCFNNRGCNKINSCMSIRNYFT